MRATERELVLQALSDTDAGIAEIADGYDLVHVTITSPGGNTAGIINGLQEAGYMHHSNRAPAGPVALRWIGAKASSSAVMVMFRDLAAETRHQIAAIDSNQ